MTTSESSSGIRVSLSNRELWEKFYPINEMIVKGAGRKLFPDMKVRIGGLAPDVLYTVSFHLERVNNFKYLFIKDKQSGTGEWRECSSVETTSPIEKKQHSNGKASGAKWMDSPVSFSQIYISNDKKLVKNPKMDPIFVQTRHKYQPVITVQRCDNGFEEEFRITMTEFMVVTEYQNPKILELKKLNNKKASGFCPGGRHFEKARFQGDTPRGTKRANDANPTSSSTVASPKKTSVPPPSKKSAPASGTPSTMASQPSFDSASVEPSSGGFNTPNMTTSPTTTTSNMTFGMPTDSQNPTCSPPPMPTASSIGELEDYQHETFTPFGSPMTPTTRLCDKENDNQMVTPSTYKTPPFGGPAVSMNQQRFTPPDMSRSSIATPPPATSTHLTPQSGDPADFNDQAFTPPDVARTPFTMATPPSLNSTTMASPFGRFNNADNQKFSPLDMRAPQAYNSAMIQPVDFVKWCDSQLEDAPTLWDYESHDSAQFGNE